MKNSIIIATLSMLIILSIASCSGNKEKSNNDTTQTEMAHYQCPMKCEGDKTYDKPGKCPVCNMDLAKVESAEEKEEEEGEHDHNH